MIDIDRLARQFNRFVLEARGRLGALERHALERGAEPDAKGGIDAIFGALPDIPDVPEPKHQTPENTAEPAPRDEGEPPGRATGGAVGWTECQCPDCYGTGKDTHDVGNGDCGYCSGTGTVHDQVVVGQCETIYSQKAEIARLKAEVSDTKEALAECQASHGATYGTDWSNWKLAHANAEDLRAQLAAAERELDSLKHHVNAGAKERKRFRDTIRERQSQATMAMESAALHEKTADRERARAEQAESRESAMRAALEGIRELMDGTSGLSFSAIRALVDPALAGAGEVTP